MFEIAESPAKVNYSQTPVLHFAVETKFYSNFQRWSGHVAEFSTYLASYTFPKFSRNRQLSPHERPNYFVHLLKRQSCWIIVMSFLMYHVSCFDPFGPLAVFRPILPVAVFWPVSGLVSADKFTGRSEKKNRLLPCVWRGQLTVRASSAASTKEGQVTPLLDKTPKYLVSKKKDQAKTSRDVGTL